MNWDAIGALGEVAGAAGVILTLLYLSVQIRNQNREARADSTHQILDALRRENDLLKRPAEGGIYFRGLFAFKDLTDVERFQFRQMNMGLFRVFEEAYYHFRERHLDSVHWEALEGQLKSLLALENIKHSWLNGRDSFTEDFSKYVEGLIVEQPPANSW